MTDHAIPTIDFGPFREDGLQRDDVIRHIGKACEEYGFMQLIGHGLSLDVINDAIEAGKLFFSLPEDEKRKVIDVGTMRGFSPLFDVANDGEKPSGQEAFCMGHPNEDLPPELTKIPFYAPTPWPELPAFRRKVEAAYAAMYQLGQSFMQAVAAYLGQPEEFFSEISKESYSNLRLNHYPPAEKVAAVADYGVRPHVDQGLITLLLQDMQGGLFVMGPNNEWLPVKPNPSAVVVNIGNMLRRWTNGRFKSALHKVENTSGDERYSMPLFVHPSFKTVVDPRSLVGEQPAREEFERVVAGEFVYASMRAERARWRNSPASV